MQNKYLAAERSLSDVSSGTNISGIKEVYELVGRLPIIDVESETVSVEIPWIESSELHRGLTDMKLALESYKQEIKSK